MHKLLAFLFLTAISSVNAGELSVDTRCLSDSKKKINLEFRIYTDSDIGWVGGQLRYRQSEKYIQLVYKSTKTLREVEDIPWEFQHTWLEILNGAITGKYEMVSQGAIVYKFTYTNEITGKTVDISNETYTDKNGKCTWG